MKKLLLPICAVLMCMTSCQKDENDILTLVMEGYSSDAKLHLDNEGYTLWDSGDGVWINGTEYEVTVNDNTATISNVEKTNSSYTAIYPFGCATGISGIAYPATQKYEVTNSGLQKIAAPMAGLCVAGESTLKFRNLGAILAVNVTNSTSATMHVKKIEVIAENGEKLWGNYRIDYGNYSISHLSDGSGSNKVTLDCGTGVSINANDSKKFYIALPPKSYKLTVKVYEDYYYYAKSQGAARQLLKSYGYNAGIEATGLDADRKQYAPMKNQIMYTTTNMNALDQSVLGNVETVTGNYRVDENWFVSYDTCIYEIPDEAFRTNPYITSVTFPEMVTKIGASSFSLCSNLTTVYLGPNINNIRGGAFSESRNLTNVYCTSVYSVDFEHDDYDRDYNIAYIFYDLPATATLHLRKEISDYNYNLWKDAWWYNGFDEEEWQASFLERPIIRDL